MSIQKTNKRAARGAKLLDEKRPGWHRIINRDILDIQDPEYCVLGQQDGYNDMIEEFFGDLHCQEARREYTRHGFDLSVKAYNSEDSDLRFDMLNLAWRHEITERLNADQN